MKKIFVIGLLLMTITISAHDYKKLILTMKGTIDKNQPIYIEPIDNDRVLVVNYLQSSLKANGFKVVAEKEDAYYVIIINYKHRNDVGGCGGRVIKNLNGQIINAKNNAEIVADFSFKQGSFEGKCTSNIMSALAKKIANEASREN